MAMYQEVLAGGSRAVFFQVNTLSESAFLDRGVDALGSFGGGAPLARVGDSFTNPESDLRSAARLLG